MLGPELQGSVDTLQVPPHHGLGVDSSLPVL